MNTHRNTLWAGLVIVLSIAGAAGIIVAIKGLAPFVDPTDLRYVSFTLRDDIGGLAVGDDVRIGGYRVGEVLAIELVDATDRRLAGAEAPPQEQMLLVSISLPRKYALRQGARVAIQSTVTGQSNLNFDSLGGGPALPPTAGLRGRPGALTELLATVAELRPRVASIVAQVDTRTLPAATGAMEVLRDKTFPAATETIQRVRDTTVPRVDAALDDFRVAAASAGATMDRLRAQIEPIVQRYQIVADAARAMMDEIRDVFGATKTDLRATAANLNAATASIREKLPGILDKADGVLAKADGAVAGATEALADIRQVAASARELVGGNASKIEAMVESLKNTARNLERASVEIRHSPWRLLYQPKSGELANLNLFDSAREFASGAANLNDAAQALRDAVRSGSADPQRVQVLMKQLEEQFEKFHTVENQLWEQVKP
jgi:ABC-type transporter Mla subunit MlaD